MIKNISKNIPETVSHVTQTLKKAGFEAYIVGGCVRDLILGLKPKDWDVTTNATPEQIIPLFTNTFYENDFGTVGMVNQDVSDETLRVIEVTPYRVESGYSDMRHPDEVKFSQSLDEDLKRRDFTMNAIACDTELVDPHKGQEDISERIVRTVGDPDKRFQEDALRMLRAIRFTAVLGFQIESKTKESILKNKGLLEFVSKERIRDEFIRIILSKNPQKGLEACIEAGIMSYIIPELEEGIDIGQNKAHKYNVIEHLLRTLQCAADKDYSLELRLASLLHDIGKPRSRRWADDKKEWTFYGHDVIGAKMAEKILDRLKFPRKTIDLVKKFVRWHMFFSDTEHITLSAVRRIVVNIGRDNVWDLMNLRVCDRVGTGRPKENPYRLRKYKSMVEEALRDPISVGMLKLDGKDIIAVTKSNPSPKIGHILHALLEEVLEDPLLNTEEYLNKRAVELNELPADELEKIGKSGKEKKAEEEEKEIEELRKKYFL